MALYNNTVKKSSSVYLQKLLRGRAFWSFGAAAENSLSP